MQEIKKKRREENKPGCVKGKVECGLWSMRASGNNLEIVDGSNADGTKEVLLRDSYAPMVRFNPYLSLSKFLMSFPTTTDHPSQLIEFYFQYFTSRALPSEPRLTLYPVAQHA